MYVCRSSNVPSARRSNSTDIYKVIIYFLASLVLVLDPKRKKEGRENPWKE